MDLVACEPQLASPVAAAYDENGKLYVVEMRDYPNPLSRGKRDSAAFGYSKTATADGRL